MRHFADLHIHSKYARACSPQLTPENIDLWCRIKGLSVVATGDFTHPKWFSELKEKLEPAEAGLYKLKNKYQVREARFHEKVIRPVRFMVSTEISCIYTHAGKARRVHLCVYLPSLSAAEKLITVLEKRGCNLKADGRPIIGMSAQELLKIILDIDENSVMVPAHIWTPWFAVFGSKSGYDSLEECFGNLTDKIFAVETGLSSDPAMNWRLSQLDKVALISNSDAHSLQNLGRESNIFEGDIISYSDIWQAVKNSVVTTGHLSAQALKFAGTVEFFPHEGKYHYDGHRVCGVVMSPSESKMVKKICPKCGKELVIGVLNRVEALADRKESFRPKKSLPFYSLVELDKIIADAQGVKGRKNKAVEKEYWEIISQFGGEMNILLNTPLLNLKKEASKIIFEGIKRIRDGKIEINPGYDGEYGKIKIFSEQENRKSQSSLF